MAVTDLAQLLSSLSARLDPEPYVWASVAVAPEDCVPVATVMEDEGLTVVVPEAAADEAGLAWQFRSARVTLEVHSSLEAVGLTAAFTRALADEGVSANVVAGFHHDHVFVPWNRREDAIAALARLQADASE